MQENVPDPEHPGQWDLPTISRMLRTRSLDEETKRKLRERRDTLQEQLDVPRSTPRPAAATVSPQPAT